MKCTKLTHGRTQKWLAYLLPPTDQEEYVLQESGMTSTAATSPTTTSSLRRLLDETSDIIDSPTFSRVLTRLLDAAFSHLIDIKISQLSYKIPPISENTARVQEIIGNDIKAKVASSLAVFCRQAHSIGSGANNEYLAAVEQVGDLEAFAAVVYSSNFEFESPEVGPSASASRPATAGGDGNRVSLATAEELPAVNIEEAAAGASSVGDAGFESAWKHALAKEDGKEFGKESGA